MKGRFQFVFPRDPVSSCSEVLDLLGGIQREYDARKLCLNHGLSLRP